MSRVSLFLILLSSFTFNAYASSVLPQATSTGADGDFNLLQGNDTLFSNSDNIYNFISFNIADGATLNIASSGPVYIYAQQSISIGGNLFADTPDLHLIAPTIATTGNANITANNINLTILDSGAGNPSTDTGGGITLSSGNPGSVSPVPLPGALWLMLTGLLSLGLMNRRR